MSNCLIFEVNQFYFGLDLSFVERVIWAVEMITLPSSSSSTRIININGAIIPILDLRQVLGFNKRELELEDQIILTFQNHKKLAIWVDNVKGVDNLIHENLTDGSTPFSYSPYIENIVKSDQKLIFILCLSRLMDLCNLSANHESKHV